MLNTFKMLSSTYLGGRITNNICKHFFSQVRLNGNWHLELLKERTILKVSGPMCNEFLQGLVTNDINLLSSQSAVYSMFLNTKGRILYDSIIYRTDCENTFLIECDTKCAGDVEKHLNIYKVRRKIVIHRGEYAVWAVFSQCTEKEGDLKLELNEKSIVCPDPRLPDLGYRAVTPVDTDLHSTDNCYKMYRYKLGIAEGIDEIPIGKCFPFEMNCDYLNGVSFNKGCYIGQELTARTYHTGVVRKRLMPFSFVNTPENVALDDVIIDNALKVPTVGKVRALLGNLGLGLMRVTETLASTNLQIGKNYLKCSKPLWWPNSEQYAQKKNL